MPPVLVLVEHEDGVTKKVTFEMLTKARDLGDPVAVFVGEGLEAAREGLARHGATAVYAAGGDNRLAGPLTGALAAAADRAEPAAVLVAATPLAKDAGARLAARKGWGMLADIVDLDGDLVANQNVFGGATTVRARVRTGTPVLAVKPNSFPVEEAPAEAELIALGQTGEGGLDRTRVTD
ncbi:MAG TPA: electron transfer flavoprotein subunit alpha/FixB family protein, partial [Actinomycetes bacterium]|nr:electron transfer flavoprotein subunit alpha/FixB family protein [Actinomycetes bacterium]